MVPGARTVENTEAVVEDFKRRTAGRPMNLITSDEYSAYEGAILRAYGRTVTPARTGRPGRPKSPCLVPGPGLKYAVVEKTRERGRVVKESFRIDFGSKPAVRRALAASQVSRAINTAFVERQNGTDRHRNARKARKTYRSSKDWRHHEAVTFLSRYSYNFCWSVRTPALKDDEGRRVERTPAMVAGLADHVWSMAEWLSFPAVQRR